MSDELLPCPFCGGEGWYFNHTYEDGLTLHNTRCKTCYVSHDGHPSADMAIAAWNTRANTRYKTALETIVCDREVLTPMGIYNVALNALKGKNDE